MADRARHHKHDRASSDHHEHSHGHGREVDHDGWAVRLWGRIWHTITPHSHDPTERLDPALEISKRGMRTLVWSFVALFITAIIQLAVVAISGSMALLSDTIHNFADALTALPLGIAFLLGRRPANRRYTYGRLSTCGWWVQPV